MLAYSDDETVEAVIATRMRPYTDRTIATADALHRELARVRAYGYSVTDGHIHRDSRGIGVPVFGPHGRVYAGIGVVVPNDGTSPLPYIEILREAATGIARTLAAIE